jgi:TRAP-type C4-dicarboxylate transport system substrate-binding protein
MQGRIEVLFHHVTGARTATTTKGYGKTIKTPDDIAKVQFRIPASKALGGFYQLAGATPIKARWKNVALLAKAKRLNALDPSIIGLYNGPNNLKEHLGAISEIESVQDGWMTVVSQQWYQSLPVNLQIAIKDAAEKTFVEHLENILQIEQNCQQELMALGTQFYQPTQDEKSQWISCCGHQRQEWNSVKRALLEDEKLFAHLVEATQINNGFML